MIKPAHWLLGAFLLPTLIACSRDDGSANGSETKVPSAADLTFLADNAIWRGERKQRLLQPDGWTSLVGLHWLELKAHYIGSGLGSGIKLAVGPAKLGMVQQQGERVYFTPERGLSLTLNGAPLRGRVELVSDQGEVPGVIGFDDGKGALSLIRRGQRFGLRLKHADASSRLNFAGLEYWPVEKDWNIKGKFVAHPAGKTMSIGDIVGTTSDVPNPGAVEFERDGKTYRIEAMGEANGELFLVLADRTSGHGSYPAGRFMDTPAADAAGNVELDFNRAYSPPCAFTPFATCPLPPPENRLDLAITAGEKTYSYAKAAASAGAAISAATN